MPALERRATSPTGVQDSVLPLVKAVDVFLHDNPELAPLPALSQYVEETRRIDVSLQVPPTLNSSRLVEIQCYMSAQFVHLYLIEDAAARGSDRGSGSAEIGPARPVWPPPSGSRIS